MPLEHFGTGSWQKFHKRPLSDISHGHASTSMTRATSDFRDRGQVHSPFEGLNGKDAQEGRGSNEDDDAILSKLTGVSRSVSWGRGTSNRQQTSRLQTNFLPGEKRCHSTPKNSSRPINPSLAMSPSMAKSALTYDDEDSPNDSTSSPASSAALSLRSLSACDNERTHQGILNQASPFRSTFQPQAHDYRALSDPAPSNSRLRPGITEQDLGSPKSRLLSSPEIPESQLYSTSFPTVSVDAHEMPISAELASAEGPRISLRSPVPQRPLPGSRRESGSDLDTSLNDVPVRRHMGSFYLRKQSSNPDLSHSIRSIDSIIDDDCNGIGQGESRLRIGPIRFFSRFFHDDMPRGTRSGSTSPNSFSPPSSSLHPGASFRGLNDLRRSFNMGRPSSLAQTLGLSAKQALPRPPRSPMVSAIASKNLEVDDDDIHEIHGLTTRSSTPVRSLSPPTMPNQVYTSFCPEAGLAKLNIQDSHASDVQNMSAYELGEEIGSGAYGFVRRARSRDRGEEVVIKYIFKSSIFADSWRRHRIYGTIPGEIFVLLQLQHTSYTPPPSPPRYIANKSRWEQVRDTVLAEQSQGHTTGHPGICKLLEFFEDNDYYYMVMPRFGNGQDLFNYVESSPYGLEPREVRSFLGQVADVIAFMHSNGIVHRDIKDENVILDSYGMVQLIDFGGAARIRPGLMFDTFSGTMDYAALEILRGEKYSGPPQDVWAFGVLGYVLVCGECPFANVEEASVGMSAGARPLLVLQHFCLEQSPGVHSLANSDSSQDENIPPPDNGGHFSQLCDLICQCLQHDPSMRPSANDILHHAFLFGNQGWMGPCGWRH